ncbi:MAG: aminotransferase class V-fold PLP-dependent enzyme, partial [Anaerolineae bacterium]|nr:aminotransferase class V-fold PLP-dependent enzyme [Anaerolineae bacterium]
MTDKLARLRAQLPAVQDVAFLNTGTCGPLPTVTDAAIRHVIDAEYNTGRAGTDHFMQMMQDGDAVRTDFAALLHVAPESLALTHHTTDGMNIATFGFDWQPGDEVATTTLEHEAGLYPLYVVQTRFGVKINFADVGLGADPLDAIDAALTPRTRLLSLSHVSYSAGTCFPLREIIKLAHAKG